MRREFIGEFLGTWVLLVFGLGVNAQVTLSGEAAGSFLSVNLGWGIALTMAAYVSGQFSGAHLNPAITLALAAYKKLPLSKVPTYVAGQMLGAFSGAATVFFAYYEAIHHFDAGVRQVTGAQETASIFATYPQPFLSSFPGGFVDQVLGTALLALLVFALTDRRNAVPKTEITPILLGAAVLLIGMTFGFNTGYAINPARDFGPRLFTFFAGWGSEVFTARDFWFWVPLVAPCVGALLGGGLYLWGVQKLSTSPPLRST